MTDFAALATILDDASRNASPVSQLTEAHPDLGLADAYQVMAALIRRRLDRGERRLGVKMGLTSRAKMIQVNVDEVIWGVLTDAMLIPEGESLDLARFIHPRVEPEIACRLRKPLAGEVDAATAADAIEAVAPAMEIIDSRYQNFKFRIADVVADNSSASALVLGRWRSARTEIGNLGMIMSFNGRPVQVGSSAAILGHPLRALIAAARLTARDGDGLKAGDVVMLGASTAAEHLRPGLSVRLSVQNLGWVGFQTGAAA